MLAQGAPQRPAPVVLQTPTMSAQEAPWEPAQVLQQALVVLAPSAQVVL
jgi:hypothetical protein